MDDPQEDSGIDSGIDQGSASYSLFGFISHKGTSTACGHYVAHIKIEGRWVLFNDERVVAVPDVEAVKACQLAYMLFYKRD